MKKLIAALIGSGLIFLLSAITQAGSAQWDLNPGSHDWNTAANWMQMTVRNGPADTAMFGSSTKHHVSISANTEVNGITFTPAATTPYTITASGSLGLTISGTGITNNSGITQKIVADENGFSHRGVIVFTNSATAGSSTIFTNNGATVTGNQFLGGTTTFTGTSTAGNATIINNAAKVGSLFDTPNGGATFFYDNSTAGSATIINNGATKGTGNFNSGTTYYFSNSTPGNAIFTNNAATVTGGLGGITQIGSTAGNATFNNNGSTVFGANSGVTEFLGGSAANGTFNNNGGSTLFFGFSTAGNGTFNNNPGPGSNGGGDVVFFDNSTAGAATFIANGGTGGAQGGAIVFEFQSTGGTARIALFGNGELDMRLHGQSLTIGSLEGTGNVFLGATNLTVGSNNLSTTFSGVIQDNSQFHGTNGSLTKIGSGTLDLTGSNTYIGDTNINGGVLKVDGSITSNTFINSGGTLAGTGTVHGSVTSNNGGKVSPGGALGALTINGNYTQTSQGTLLIGIAGANAGQFSVLDVLGNANLNGFLHPVLLHGFIPTVGESFTFMDYATLSGAFSFIRKQTFDHGLEKWSITYQNTDAILTAQSTSSLIAQSTHSLTAQSTNSVPDHGSTLLLLTLSLLGLATYRQKCCEPHTFGAA